MLETPARVGVQGSDIGLRAFLTTTPPLGGRLKVRIEDFQVEEIGPEPPPDAAGPFTAARIRLTNWETNRFVQEAAHLLEMSRKKIRFRGTKDKRGITVQTFTFEAEPERVRALSRLNGVDVEDAYKTRGEVALGDHRENRFHIVVRDIAGPRERAESILRATGDEVALAGGCPNFFGPQRFGSVRATTHRVGERMLRGDFEGAVLAYLATPSPHDAPELAQVKSQLGSTRDWKGMLALMEGDVGFERALLHRLVETQGDSIAALQALPQNLQWLFVSAFQSYLFNEILSRRLLEGIPLNRALVGDLVAPVEAGEVQEEWVPVASTNERRVNEEIARGRAVVTGVLPGTEVAFAAGRMGELERAVLREARVEPRDFLIPEHLPWSSKGTRRALLLPVREPEWKVEPDDLHPDRWKVAVTFRLHKGSYATTVLREFLKSDRQDDYA